MAYFPKYARRLSPKYTSVFTHVNTAQFLFFSLKKHKDIFICHNFWRKIAQTVYKNKNCECICRPLASNGEYFERLGVQLDIYTRVPVKQMEVYFKL